MKEKRRLSLLRSAGNPAEAQIVRAVLEDSGIYALIPDKNVPLPGVDLTPYDPGGAAGCDVYVPEEDLDRAREAIREARDAGKLLGNGD